MAIFATDPIEQCYDAGWTDGLPVVPPTPERVAAMLGEHEGDASAPLFSLPPGGGDATLEKVAANAVMAGCRPEYFPVVVSALRALAEPAFDLESCVTTVHSVSPLVLVSGPAAGEVGMNGGACALGAGNRANATIGRAVLLCIRNLGLARPGGLDATTLGHPGKYSFCFTESASSPWASLSVDRGFRPDESTVTVYAADAPFCVCDYGHTEPEEVLRTIAISAAVPGSYNAFFRKELWLVLSPEHAEIVASAGWSKSDACAYIHECARLPVSTLLRSGLFGFADELNRPAWLDSVGPNDAVSIVESPDNVVITVAGAPYGGYTAVILGKGMSVTRAIESV